jgi:hypothetical protein
MRSLTLGSAVSLMFQPHISMWVGHSPPVQKLSAHVATTGDSAGLDFPGTPS